MKGKGGIMVIIYIEVIDLSNYIYEDKDEQAEDERP